MACGLLHLGYLSLRNRRPKYILAMEGNCKNMSRVRVYLTHLLPALQKIQKRCSSLTQRQRAIRFAADMCLARTANKGSAWTRALNLRLMRKDQKTMKIWKSSLRRSRNSTALGRRMRMASLNSRCCNNVDLETSGHDHVAIDRKLGTLQKLVPGGRKMGVDTLFPETADYILNLQMQVQAMEVLADFYTTISAGNIDESVVQQQQQSSEI